MVLNLFKYDIIKKHEKKDGIRIVSPEAQTRTTGAKITALLRTLTRVKACWISFAQEKKKYGYFYFSSSTKLC